MEFFSFTANSIQHSDLVTISSDNTQVDNITVVPIYSPNFKPPLSFIVLEMQEYIKIGIIKITFTS